MLFRDNMEMFPEEAAREEQSGEAKKEEKIEDKAAEIADAIVKLEEMKTKIWENEETIRKQRQEIEQNNAVIEEQTKKKEKLMAHNIVLTAAVERGKRQAESLVEQMEKQKRKKGR